MKISGPVFRSDLQLSPSCYVTFLSRQVLSAMGRLSPYGDVRQRLFETLHFVKIVVLGSPREIKEACMRVRLLHASVRYHLCHRDGGWEIEKVSAIYFEKCIYS